MPGKGLYAITPQWYPDRARLLDAVRAALCGGAAVIQFRDKSGDGPWRRETAAALLEICGVSDAPLIINDDVELTRACGADGVHLGRADTGLATARSLLGADRVIGISCYNQYHRAVAAAASGADHLAFGSMNPSPTKPDAAKCEPGLLTRASELGLPVVAIGGITPENGASLVRAGADFLAVISAVFAQPDIESAAAQFATLWSAD